MISLTNRLSVYSLSSERNTLRGCKPSCEVEGTNNGYRKDRDRDRVTGLIGFTVWRGRCDH